MKGNEGTVPKSPAKLISGFLFGFNIHERSLKKQQGTLIFFFTETNMIGMLKFNKTFIPSSPSKSVQRRTHPISKLEIQCRLWFSV